MYIYMYIYIYVYIYMYIFKHINFYFVTIICVYLFVLCMHYNCRTVA